MNTNCVCRRFLFVLLFISSFAHNSERQDAIAFIQDAPPETINLLDASKSFHELDRELEKRNCRRKLEECSKNNSAVLNTLLESWKERNDVFEPIIRYLTVVPESIPSDEFCKVVLKASWGSSETNKKSDVRFATIVGLLAMDGLMTETESVACDRAFDWLITSIFASDKGELSKDLEVDQAVYTFSMVDSKLSRPTKNDLLKISELIGNSPKNFPITFGTIRNTIDYVEFSTRSLDELSRSFLSPDLALDCWEVEGVFPDQLTNEFCIYLQSDPRSVEQSLDAALKSNNPILPNDLNVRGKGDITLAFVAYASGRIDNLGHLLNADVDADVPLQSDMYPMTSDPLIAVSSAMFSPRKGDTILLAAALDPFRKALFLPLILKHTKRPDARDLLDRNALHRFLYHRVPVEQSNLLDLLIEAGVDVNAKSVSGNTPCHVAVNRNGNLIPAMVKAGADLQVENGHGETPLDLLRRSLEEKWIFHEQNAQVLVELEAMGAIPRAESK